MKRLWRGYGLFVWWVDLYPPHEAHWTLEWLRGVFENNTSEAWQIGTFIILSRYLLYRGSPQSRDGDDEMRAQLERIERLLRERNAG